MRSILHLPKFDVGVVEDAAHVMHVLQKLRLIFSVLGSFDRDIFEDCGLGVWYQFLTNDPGATLNL